MRRARWRQAAALSLPFLNMLAAGFTLVGVADRARACNEFRRSSSDL